MWSSFPSAAEERSMENCAHILGRCSASWRSRRRAGSKRAHLVADHVHMLISIPPKYAVSQVVGFIKGKSAIHLARVYGEREEQLRRSALLGEGLLCFHSRAGPRGD